MLQTHTVALHYWQETGYSRADIDKLCVFLDKKYLALRADFTPDQEVSITLSTRVGETGQGHFPTVVQFLCQINQIVSKRGVSGSIVVLLEDGVWRGLSRVCQWAPTLTFGKPPDDYYSFLVPDPGFLQGLGYLKELDEIEKGESQTPWEKKRPVFFWRGACSGPLMEQDDWMNCLRIRLSLFARKFNDCSKLDASITKIPTFADPSHNRRVEALDILTEHVPFPEFQNYKFLIDVDGVSCAWISCFLKLATKSALVKVYTGMSQWYYERLIPWKNYIPVQNDLSDLPDIIEWALHHDRLCEEIGQNGSELARSLTYQEQVESTADLITSILRCQSGESGRELC